MIQTAHGANDGNAGLDTSPRNKKRCVGLMLVAMMMAASCSTNAPTASAVAAEAKPLHVQRTQDADEFCRFVAGNYAYFDVKKTNWPRVCLSLRAQAALAADRTAFVSLLERALAELYDAHAHLSTSTSASPRLIPTHTDLWVVWRGDNAVIEAVRADSAAFKAGARAGMTVLEVNDEPISAAARAREPRFLIEADPAARDWALQSVLAGRQNQQPVRLKVAHEGQTSTLSFNPDRPQSDALLTHRRLGPRGDVGVIRFNIALGEAALIAAFDAALTALNEADVQALVLDLRDTPSGGNSSVARGIMGRLVSTEAPYQRHESISEFRATGVRRVWTESVLPRGEAWRKPVVVLVGRWTGSMGEGIAVGLHAARAAPILGSPMARLLGAIEDFRLSNSGIGVRIATEKLFSPDGAPRESFVPCAPLPVAASDAAGAASTIIDTLMSIAVNAFKNGADASIGTSAPTPFVCR